MTGKFLCDAISDVKDDYVLEAGQLRSNKKQAGKRKHLWKPLLVAALIPVLMITAYAADFLNIQSLVSGAEHFRSSNYQDIGKAMKKAGFQIDAVEQFESGYAFQNLAVQDTRGLDENGKEVLKYREIQLGYQNAAGNRVHLTAEPGLEEITVSETPVAQSRGIAGVTVDYRLSHYKFVPADYQLTEADKLWQQQPGNYISYGSDQAEQHDIASLNWEKDGVRYLLMDTDAVATPEVLFSMAAELIRG